MMLPLTILLLAAGSSMGGADKGVQFMCASEGAGNDLFFLHLKERGDWISFSRVAGRQWPDPTILLLNKAKSPLVSVEDGRRVSRVEASGASDSRAGPSSGTRYRVNLVVKYPEADKPVGADNPIIVSVKLASAGFDLNGSCVPSTPSTGSFE